MQLLDPDFIFEVAPSFLQPLSTMSVVVGGTAVIKCRICGRPRPAIAWTGPDEKVIATSSCNLTLSYSDDGTAMIEVSYQVGYLFNLNQILAPLLSPLCCAC